MPSQLICRNVLDRFISNRRDVWLVLIITVVSKKKSVFNAKCVNADQTPRSVPSDLGLHYLPMLLLWDARHYENMPIQIH